MSSVLAVVQVVALLLMLTPLVIVVVCALRRSGQKIDQILREECGQDTVPSRDDLAAQTLSGDRAGESKPRKGSLDRVTITNPAQSQPQS